MWTDRVISRHNDPDQLIYRFHIVHWTLQDKWLRSLLYPILLLGRFRPHYRYLSQVFAYIIFRSCITLAPF